jgi:hypothetical protein
MANRRAKWLGLWRSAKKRPALRVRPTLEGLEARDVPSTAPVSGALVQVGPSTTPWPNTSDLNGQSGTNYLNSEVEPRVAVDPTNPMHLVGVWQQDRWSNGGSRGIVSGVSTDGGNTWTVVPLPDQTVNTGGQFLRSSDPWVSIGPDGTVYAVTLPIDNPTTGAADGVFATVSHDGGNTWANPTLITASESSQSGNDKEAVTADPTKAGYAYAVWDQLNGGGPALFSRTTDGGTTWSAPQSIYDPANGQTIGNQIVVLPNGTLVDVTLHIDYTGLPDQIVVLTSTNQGSTWSGPTVVATPQGGGVSDPDNGAGVREGGDLPEAAVDPVSGNLYVAWGDSRFNVAGISAIALTMSTDGGQTWSAPVQANLTPTNVPNADQQAFTPTVAVGADGEVAVSYYDFRNNTTAPGDSTDAWISFANPALSGPLAFGNEQRLTNTSFNMQLAPNAFGEFVGDYEGLTNGGQTGDTFDAFFVQAISSTEPSATFSRVVVAPNPLAVTNLTPLPSPTEGKLASGTVATFTDASLDHNLNEYTAVVSWGDGTSDTVTAASGNIVANGDGSFSVHDSHAYVAESTGDTFSVTVTTPGGFSATSSTTVKVADAALSAAGGTIKATEGINFRGTVAAFKDNATGEPAGNYTAQINWGDGTVGPGTVRAGSTPGMYTVVGSHTYKDAGSYNITVSVLDAGGSTATAFSTATVGDAALTGKMVAINPVHNQPFSGTVAEFTDANPFATLSDYTATIDWGDGTTPTAGSVVIGPTGFDITGTHTYANAGAFTISVTLVDKDGSKIHGKLTITVT